MLRYNKKFYSSILLGKMSNHTGPMINRFIFSGNLHN